MTIDNFCAEVKNYFDVDRRFGRYTISGGKIQIPDMLPGQYFRICDSVFNDGVYKYPAENLTDEVFDGAIWYMAVPPDVVSLIDDMTTWETKNADAINSPYQSESFGGYSCSLRTGGTSSGSGGYTAFDHFSNRLNRWRKVRCV